MNSFGNIKTIAKRELRAYFASPVAYVFIVIFLLLNGFFTFMIGGFFERGEASLANSFFMWHPWFYLFLVPAVGMRLWADERRVGTLELLLTMPIAPWEAIAGKFMASWIFLGLALVLTFPVVLTVNHLGSPDNGVIFAAYIGNRMAVGIKGNNRYDTIAPRQGCRFCKGDCDRTAKCHNFVDDLMHELIVDIPGKRKGNMDLLEDCRKRVPPGPFHPYSKICEGLFPVLHNCENLV